MSAAWGNDVISYPPNQFNVTASMSKDIQIGNQQVGHVSMDFTGVLGTIDSNDEEQAMAFLGEFVAALEAAGFDVQVIRDGGKVTAPLEITD